MSFSSFFPYKKHNIEIVSAKMLATNILRVSLLVLVILVVVDGFFISHIYLY